MLMVDGSNKMRKLSYQNGDFQTQAKRPLWFLLGLSCG